jgi:hypothetical protein
MTRVATHVAEEDGQVVPTRGTMRLISLGLGVSLKFLSEMAEEFESSGDGPG